MAGKPALLNRHYRRTITVNIHTTLPGYLPEYDKNNQVWYRGGYPGVFTVTVPYRTVYDGWRIPHNPGRISKLDCSTTKRVLMTERYVFGKGLRKALGEKFPTPCPFLAPTLVQLYSVETPSTEDRSRGVR